MGQTIFVPRDQQLYRIHLRFDNVTDELNGIKKYIPSLNMFLAESANLTKFIYERQRSIDHLTHLADYISGNLERVARSTTTTRKRTHKIKMLTKWLKGEI